MFKTCYCLVVHSFAKGSLSCRYFRENSKHKFVLQKLSILSQKNNINNQNDWCELNYLMKLWLCLLVNVVGLRYYWRNQKKTVYFLLLPTFEFVQKSKALINYIFSNVSVKINLVASLNSKLTHLIIIKFRSQSVVNIKHT